ncbi:MAG: hypothetical protein LBI85_06070 [Spirochaetaceae bacterium]|jgi:hypothetical protein|nr:hypothetical protein [Spirochaetaceae bacterium]
MAKKRKDIYAPGELSRVRKQLGVLDDKEAKLMAAKLGGEVGYERSEAARNAARVRHETVDVMVGARKRAVPKHRVELAPLGDSPRQRVTKQRAADPGDDPGVPLRLNYRERVKMDRYAGQIEFEIKSTGQVLYSMVAIFGETPDYINPRFITRRMDEYYKRIEQLVTATRTMLPRNNLQRNERLRRVSPFSFSVLDTIRYWNIDRIAGDLAKLQARPRSVKVTETADIIRAVYRPLYILANLDTETHIRDAFKLLYKILYLENPGDAKAKYQDLVRNALNSYVIIKRDISYLLFPLLLKLVSDKFIPYEDFFAARKNRFRVFLNVTEQDRLVYTPPKEGEVKAQDEEAEGKTEEEDETGKPGFTDEVLTQEEKDERAAREAESKALYRAYKAMELLFPKAGWERFATYPDLYPYFHDVFHFMKGCELISPTDPVQQVMVLMRILEELFFGLRYVRFGAVTGPDGNQENIADSITHIISDWHNFIEIAFEKEYLPRLSEYCRILDSVSESKTSPYARRILNELHWVKRLYLLPYYKFESNFPPPMSKREVSPVYPEVRTLRKYLTAAAAGIEQAKKRGGAEQNAHCQSVENPWDEYNFEVANPISLRMDALLGGKNSRQRNNAALVFFTLSASVLLDFIMNSERSWAYNEQTGFLFRSVNGEGLQPLIGVDTKLDTETIFKHALKQRERQQEDRSPADE